MDKNDLYIEIKKIKKEINELNKKVSILERNLSEYKAPVLPNNDYEQYLISKGLSRKTVSNYRVALKSLRALFEQYLEFKIDLEIFEITDINLILELREKFKNSKRLQEINSKRHNFLSAALNNYFEYLRAENQTDEFVFENDPIIIKNN